MLDIVAYSFLLINMVVLFVHSVYHKQVELIAGCLTVTAIWLITLVSLFSIRKIQQISAKLQSLNIAANHTFMKAYTALFFGVAIVNTVSLALAIMRELQSNIHWIPER